MLNVAIIDYGMGNVASVAKAVSYLGYNPIVTREETEIINSSFIILPGVGAFCQGMANLSKYGLVEILNQEVQIKKKPFLGICLGMQLIMTTGNEPHECLGLGWINGDVIRINNNLSIPHIGWNELIISSSNFLDEFNNKDFYFVHSYHAKVIDESVVIARVNYGYDYVAIVNKDNIIATQFHPEKSQKYGLELLKKFFELNVKS